MDYQYVRSPPRLLGSSSLCVNNNHSHSHLRGSISAELQASNRLAAHIRGQTVTGSKCDVLGSGCSSPNLASMRKCASVQSLSTPKPILAMRRVKFKVLVLAFNSSRLFCHF